MKAELKFDLEDFFDSKRFNRTVNADRAYCTLHEIANEIFRPARKHGYHEKNINDLLNKIDKLDDNCLGSELIGLLEDKFYLLLSENKIDIEDYQ